MTSVNIHPRTPFLRDNLHHHATKARAATDSYITKIATVIRAPKFFEKLDSRFVSDRYICPIKKAEAQEKIRAIRIAFTAVACFIATATTGLMPLLFALSILLFTTMGYVPATSLHFISKEEAQIQEIGEKLAPLLKEMKSISSLVNNRNNKKATELFNETKHLRESFGKYTATLIRKIIKTEVSYTEKLNRVLSFFLTIRKMVKKSDCHNLMIVTPTGKMNVYNALEEAILNSFIQNSDNPNLTVLDLIHQMNSASMYELRQECSTQTEALNKDTANGRAKKYTQIHLAMRASTRPDLFREVSKTNKLLASPILVAPAMLQINPIDDELIKLIVDFVAEKQNLESRDQRSRVMTFAFAKDLANANSKEDVQRAFRIHHKIDNLNPIINTIMNNPQLRLYRLARQRARALELMSSFVKELTFDKIKSFTLKSDLFDEDKSIVRATNYLCDEFISRINASIESEEFLLHEVEEQIRNIYYTDLNEQLHLEEQGIFSETILENTYRYLADETDFIQRTKNLIRKCNKDRNKVKQGFYNTAPTAFTERRAQNVADEITKIDQQIANLRESIRRVEYYKTS